MKVEVLSGTDVWELRRLHWGWDPSPDEAIMMRVDGEPVSVVRLFKQKHLVSNGRSLLVSGIGGVYTREDKRGLGMATKLLREVIKRSHGEVAALVLFADPDRTLYADLGFELLAGRLHALSFADHSLVGHRWKLCPEEVF